MWLVNHLNCYFNSVWSPEQVNKQWPLYEKWTLGAVQVKYALELAMKTQKGNRGIALLFL